MSVRGLTPRQLEALALYAELGSAKDVGIRMGVAEQTVKNHIDDARRRLGVSSTIEAFHALGWLRVPGRTRVNRAELQAGLEAIRDRAEALLGTFRLRPLSPGRRGGLTT